jgi:HK97 family phage prohead protease
MENRESRVSTSFEVRAEEDGVTVEGYAAVFNEDTVIGGQWREQIAPSAFSDAIGRDDVVFLVNHAGLPLARTRSGTLILSEDERGLKIRASLDTSDPDVRALVPKMKRGDLDKMSFAFVPTRQKWTDVDGDDLPRRTIEQAELYDVSIVTTPAYSGTEIGLRSLEQFRKSQRKSQAARRMRMKSSL